MRWLFFIGYIEVGNSICMTYGAEDVQEQNNRQEYLERLYKKDLRFRKDHPYHGVYTGLFQSYKAVEQRSQ